jgi:NAD(P)-dependent dehydrogenase (short-subunit alcohol dehydrogenase family)
MNSSLLLLMNSNMHRPFKPYPTKKARFTSRMRHHMRVSGFDILQIALALISGAKYPVRLKRTLVFCTVDTFLKLVVGLHRVLVMFSKLEFSLHGVIAVFLLAYERFVSLLRQKHVDWEIPNDVNLAGQIIIVTGANIGIGKATATKLSKLGACVIIGCRDIQKGIATAQDINEQVSKCSKEEYPFAKHGRARFMRLDLSDLASVVEFANKVNAEFPRVDVLINNAGLNMDGMLPTGLQQLFQVNYLGHYLLVRSLYKLLCVRDRTSISAGIAVGRVVNLSSVTHHSGQPDFRASATSSYTPTMVAQYSYYSDSKLYMNYLTMELNRRFDYEKPYLLVCDQQRTAETSDAASASENAPLLASGSSADTTPGTNSTALLSGNNNKGSSPNLDQEAGVGTEGSRVRPVVAISVNPGAVRSDIWRDYPCKGLFNMVMKLLFLEVEQGAATSVHAAVLPLSHLRAVQRQQASSGSSSACLACGSFMPCLDSTCSTSSPSPSSSSPLTGKIAEVADVGGRMIYRPDIPYLVPYKTTGGCLAGEMLGRFAGSQFSPISLPSAASEEGRLVGPSQHGQSLWKYSALLCVKILRDAGVPEADFQFLQ